MPVFEYVILDPKGKKRSGIIDAESPIAARQKLRDQGSYPIKIEETVQTSGEKPGIGKPFKDLFGRVRAGHVSVMTRQLATLVGAGLPIVRALEVMIPQTPHPALKKVIAQVKDDIVEGTSFANALAQHPKAFPPIYINMVRAGEASGAIEIVLTRLADLFEKSEITKAKAQAAMVYPCIMLFVAFFIVVILVVKIVPTLTAVLESNNQVLPLPTRILIGTSDFAQSFWWAILLFVAGVIIGLQRFRKTEKGRYKWDKTILRLPVIGGLAEKFCMARFSRTLGSLLQNGVPMLGALSIVKSVVQNAVFEQVIEQAAEKVGEGRGLSDSLGMEDVIPPVALQMMDVGEHSGELEAMLDKVADMYEAETETAIMTLTSLLEPVMIIGMALVVGGIIASILMPIINMTTGVR